MKHSKSNQFLYGILLTTLVVFSTACSNKNLFLKQSSDFSSQSTSINDSTAAPLQQKVTFPAYARLTHAPILNEETELFVSTQSDQTTCLVQSVSKLMSPNEQLCLEIPDLCWSEKIALLSKAEDYTCSQAYKALEVLNKQPDQKCIEKIEDLTLDEINLFLNNPEIYTIDLSSSNSNLLVNLSESNLEPLILNKSTNLPAVSKIKLDRSCRCNYIFGDQKDTITQYYEYPALFEHCRAHFSDTYN